MQLSKNWLKDFISIDLSTQEICSQLTMAGLEVDGYEEISSDITGDDAVIKLDITPNRGDCFSVLGVARELSAINALKLKIPKIAEVKEDFKDNIGISVCPEGPAYYGRTVRNISVNSKTLPLIAERLKLSEQKLIDPVVDITNYILLELGQPLHAFDRDKLFGNISVRPANGNEEITLLDDQNLVLDESCLVISDDNGAVAFAGIMGGKKSSVSTSTKSIFLESAYFKPSAIRGKARRYGFQTDASLRYERGVDFSIQEIAIKRASALLNETVSGEFSAIVSKTLTNHLPKHSKIILDLERSNRVLGTDITKSKSIKYLKGLGLNPISSKNQTISAISPSWRYDINIEADLIEELARLEGYDSLPQDSLTPIYKKTKSSSQSYLSDNLVANGFNEIISYSFINEMDHDLFGQGVKTLEVENPISQNMTVMRTNLVPGLVNSFIYNLNQGKGSQRLFEVGNVFKLTNSGEVKEILSLAGLINGSLKPNNWNDKSKETSFYDLKGILEDLLTMFSGKCLFEKCRIEFLHPGMSSSIELNGQSIGYLGSIHPSLLDKLDIKQDIFIFSLELEELKLNSSRSYKEFSRYPSSSRDLAFILDKSITASSLEKVVKSSAGEFFKNFEIFDVYQGKGVAENKKSIAISVSWQSMKQTLLDSDIDNAVEKIVNSVQKELGGELRV